MWWGYGGLPWVLPGRMGLGWGEAGGDGVRDGRTGLGLDGGVAHVGGEEENGGKVWVHGAAASGASHVT